MLVNTHIKKKSIPKKNKDEQHVDEKFENQQLVDEKLVNKILKILEYILFIITQLLPW